MRARRYFAACYALGMFGSCCLSVAQESDNSSILLKTPIQDGLKQIELWKHVKGPDLVLSSLPGHAHGFFEYFTARRDANGRADTVQEWYDDDGSVRIKLSMTIDRVPIRISFDQTTIALSDTLQWEQVYSAPWCFVLDGQRLEAFDTDVSGIPTGYGAYIRVQPNLFLRGLSHADLIPMQWHEATRTLTLKPNATPAVVRCRTPHDHRRFGTFLSEVCACTDDQTPILLRNFIVDRESPLRLNRIDAELLREGVGPVDRGNGVLRLVQSTSKEVWKAAYPLQREIPPLDCVDPRPTVTNEARTRFRELFVAHAAFSQRLANRPHEQVKEAVESLVEELEIAYSAIEAALTKGQSDPIVDDPNVLWLAFERAVDPAIASLTFATTFANLLKSPEVSVPDKLRLCMAMGELGPPPFLLMGYARRLAPGPLLGATLHGRWNRPPTDDEVALCHAKLNAEWPVRIEVEAAIDCLIRWGLLKDVPQDKLDEWFRSKLAATPTHRHCTWKALTRNPDGRKFLLDRLESLASQPEIQRDIAQMLCHRASATLDMQRFDFMTEEECRETLRLCRPLADAPANAASPTPNAR